jgi:putative restriction endonuclease
MATRNVRSRRNWTREETLAVFNFYARTPFGRLHARNPEIVALARHLGRTASAVAMKCCNLAALDPALQSRGIRGLRGISSLDREIWEDFHRYPEQIGYESEVLFADIMQQPPRMDSENEAIALVASTDREAIRRVRVTQHLFRAMILSGYRDQCAICTLPARELLVASHIIGWAMDKAHRMNPRNGICLCSLHDRAFDTGLLNIDEEYKVHITARCKVNPEHRVAREMLYYFDGTTMTLPERWTPDPYLLARRRQLMASAP